MNKTLIAYLLIGAAILLLIYKILQGVNLIDDKTDKALKRGKGKQGKVLDPKAYLIAENGTPNQTYRNAAAARAERIYSAKGYIYATDGQAIAVFRELSSKPQASFLAAVFAKKYNQDLSTYLDFLSDSAQVTLNDILSNLPNE